MTKYLERVQLQPSRAPVLFSAGLAWIDSSGKVRASTSGGTSLNVSDRDYFKEAVATGQEALQAASGTGQKELTSQIQNRIHF